MKKRKQAVACLSFSEERHSDCENGETSGNPVVLDVPENN